MTARVLVVDDVDADLKLLDMDGLTPAAGLSRGAHPAYSGDHGDRARSAVRPGEGGAGADDFLTKPVDDILS